MKKFSRLLSLTLCALLLGVAPAMAAEALEPEMPAYLPPVQVWGRVTRLENGSLHLENSNENDPYHDIILHLPENTPCLDAVTGLPLDRELRDGETIYAWVGPAMTMSLPPQAAAELILANIPADFGVPQYYQIARVEPRAVIAIYPTPPMTHADLVTTGGEALTVTKDAVLFPYRTRQMVTLESLRPGSRILVWTDDEGAVTKVMVFAYEYRGYAGWTAEGRAAVNDAPVAVPGKVVDGEVLLPIRAVAEAAGYQVEWVAGQGAVVRESSGELVFSVLPGLDTARTAGGEEWLIAPCLFEAGVTYLPAENLLSLLNLFPTY
ncbi:stalk domain-containing protein [Dysosmobacter sp.]|uniref:stalk domain-containing protein n=1 Tax=Dysosmobacter sp. TaxID=2591382 RepID=UPI002A8A9FD9|nr:stalk domain-containing protein [Dysosmobacter sp.]MDY3280917.1 stalk domain-containing protein [Dysosmobacter sp.]